MGNTFTYNIIIHSISKSGFYNEEINIESGKYDSIESCETQLINILNDDNMRHKLDRMDKTQKYNINIGIYEHDLFEMLLVKYMYNVPYDRLFTESVITIAHINTLWHYEKTDI